MKEININIEGYNVNGICVACLNYNRKMFYHKDVKECFKILGNIDVPDGLTVQVCWECLARIKSALEFRSQILNAYDCLINYSRKHTFLDSHRDLSSHAIQRLSTVIYDCQAIGFAPEVKVEEVNRLLPDESDVKLEMDDGDAKEEGEDNIEFKVKEDVTLDVEYDDGQLPDYVKDRVSSDDDIQLSELRSLRKKKGGRKEKKRKKIKSENRPTADKEAKRTRRQRNLPEQLVELYTMCEREMWEVRERDRRSEEFLSLKHRCGACMLGFQTGKQREFHMAGKHAQKSENQCDVCESYFLSKDTLSTHRSLHLSAFRCRKCDFTTSMKRIMQRHLCAAHGESVVHACGECGKEFSTKSKLVYHRVQCSQERPQCDCCGKVFANKMTLRHHLRQTQKPANQPPKAKQFIPCKGCDKVFYSRKSYKAHVVIHNGVKYPCPVCGKLFQWKRNLARHARNHRERAAGATHACRECGKTFASRDCYNNHIRLSKRHAGESSYIHACHYCGKKFPTKWCMVDHIDWDHLKRIKYQCSVCLKAFKTAKIMVAHMNNIHDGKNKKEPDGQHLCDVCGKYYKTVKRLKGHVWSMHTSREKAASYRCPLCPATFTWQTSIYKHVKMMHDSGKRKQPRGPPAKKPEPYPDIELANRMQYFQQNLVQGMGQPAPLNIVQNL